MRGLAAARAGARPISWRRLERRVDSIAVYLSMGGYAAFVWPAFAVCAVVMATLAIVSRRALARERRLLESLDAARRARREPASQAGSREVYGES